MFEPDGRGPSAVRLLVTGLCVIIAVVVAAGLMVANSQGVFRDSVSVTAVLADVGDGLPPKSDVKYRGVLVGLVTGVSAATEAGMNQVRISLDPHDAQRIPNTVTARVVPSNVFAVPSVQLLDNGDAPPLRSGADIVQDRSLATVRLQSSLDRLRQIIASVGRDKTDNAVGVLATLAAATDGRGAAIEDAGVRLRDIVTRLTPVVAKRPAPSTLDSLASALSEVQSSAPELLDALHHSIVPMLTIAQQRDQLAALLSGGLYTTGTVESALAHREDQIIGITTHLSPALDALGDGAAHFPQISESVTHLTTEFDKVWNPSTQRITAKVIVQVTPNRQYTRADCPRYGDLAGPSCATGPASAPAGPGLPSGMNPKNFSPPASLAPPPGVPPGLGQMFAAPASLDAAPPGAAADPDIGPVGSTNEQRQIAGILGGPPNSASDILFGPLARGTTVAVVPDTPANSSTVDQGAP